MHGLVDHGGVTVGDKAEASRLPRVPVLHDDAIRQLAPLPVKLSQPLVGRLVVEPADKKLAKLFRFLFLIFPHVFFHIVRRRDFERSPACAKVERN